MNWKPVTEKPEPFRHLVMLVNVKQAYFGAHSDDITHWTDYNTAVTGLMNDNGEFKEVLLNSWVSDEDARIEVDEWARKSKVTHWVYDDEFVKQISL